ncbi:hypothetical protein PRUPE_2G092000 [Prunus persica]|uniref:Reverse transcriptase zinc-binding domain-containing protein n=1 Tax=Prunus persica TaxID=3760 RepID=M5X336_PRUPE|nr:hypothetical protein PRUPE_2G092000 [Prunus persica]
MKHRPSYSLEVSLKVWNLLWKAAIPLKMKHFLWRTVHGTLAIELALFNRKIRQTPICPLCKEHEEFVEHLILLCPWVSLIWSGVLPNWINGFWSAPQKHILRQITITAWAIWKARNIAMFDDVPLNPILTIQSITSQLTELNMILDVTRDKMTRHDEPIPTRLWYAPITPNLKIDVAWHSSSRRDGVDIIIRNAHEMFVGTNVIPFSVESAIMAEANAALKGCLFAMELGLTCACFESNSKELVDSINGNIRRGRWCLYPILTRIRDYHHNFKHCTWTWMRKSRNEATDHLATIALLRLSPGVWTSSPPLLPPPHLCMFSTTMVSLARQQVPNAVCQFGWL